MFGADNTPYRIKPPRLIADATTRKVGENLYAGEIQKAQTQARDTMTGARGFSSGANNAYYAANQQAAGAAAGAGKRAGVEAEDQQFNVNQNFDNQMLQQGANVFDFGQASAANDAMFGYKFNNQTNRASVANARRQAELNFRLAMLGEGLA
jgi:hypothetical protein